jgi:histidine ammonia-lyase
MNEKSIVLDGRSLTLEDVEAIARWERKVTVSPEVPARLKQGRAVIDEALAHHQPVYGVNTGFGAMADIRIQDADLERLQQNLLRSHATGVGEPFSVAETRAAMLLRANVLCMGYSGVRREVLDLLVAMLNRGVHPVIPSKGSVGASGDLVQLAHLGLVLIGEGTARVGNRVLPGAEALAAVDLAPVRLAAKEGISLVNGTQMSAAVGVLCQLDGERTARLADIAGALTLEALQGRLAAFAEPLHAARPHPGQRAAAANLRQLFANSAIAPTHRFGARVQDPYSLRCMPQVHGATRDALRFCRGVWAIEINSATDNPMVFPAGIAELGAILSGGNFHGQPLALAGDFMAIALAELANIAERRIEQLVNPTLSGLPAFLAPQPGLQSGFMLAQVTAAALINENKVLCHPASVDSIPSSANREDHVAMSLTAARKLRTVHDNVRYVLAIELLCAAQALDYRAPRQLGDGVAAAHRFIRSLVPPLTDDRILATDIESLVAALAEPGLLATVEAAIGPLH